MKRISFARVVGCVVRVRVLLATLVVGVLVFGPGTVSAVAASPGWRIEASALQTYVAPGGAGVYEVRARNVSGQPVGGTGGKPEENVTVTDTLPPGVTFKAVQFFWETGGNLEIGELGCQPPTGQRVQCSIPTIYFAFLGHAVEPGQAVRMQIEVSVPSTTPEGQLSDEASVEGGGTSAETSTQNTVSSTPRFGLTKLTVEPTEKTEEVYLGTESAGKAYYEFSNRPYQTPFTQAGGHPWGLTTTGEFATELRQYSGQSDRAEVVPVHDVKDVVVDLPPGLLGDPMAVPRCPLSVVTAGHLCPVDTQVGVYHVYENPPKEHVAPIVNVTPEAGQSAEFALENTTPIDVPLLTAHLVRTQEDGVERYSFAVVSKSIPQIGLRKFELTFWGVPADPSHDAARGRICRKASESGFLQCEFGGVGAGVPAVPFLSMGTDCAAGPESAVVRTDSWQEPGRVEEGGAYSSQYQQFSVPFPAVRGCGGVQFNPGTGVGVEPDTLQADEPVGLGVNLKVPLTEQPEGTTAPLLRDTRVTLPEGLSVNPGVVDGIQACNATGPEGVNITGGESEQVGLDGEWHLAAGHCPDASIVGTAEAITPYLPVPVKGHVYLARPGCGGVGQAACTTQDAEDGNLYQLYLELGGTGELADTGIEFKVPLKTQANPATGQLSAEASELVQAPYSEVRIHLNGGPRAPLANPPQCGPATTTADLTPWSAPGRTPEGSLVTGTQDSLSSSFFDVEGCQDPTPFNPGFVAGTVSPQAGQFSAFTMNLSRGDREQYVKGIQLHTPPGLLAVLSSVPLCGEPQADAGTCPEASKIGTARVATGAGSHPFEIEGAVYLTGPHDGAPFGLSIVTHVVAGPFNLGLVVVRARIDIDPSSATATITTDETGAYAVPQIVFGVPVRLQRVTVDIDRPGFMFNPTSCNGQQVTAKVSGSQQTVASVSSPFAAAGCESLAFKPSFQVSTSGHTSHQDGANLDVKLSYPPGALGSDANIASVKVSLPKQLPSRLGTLQKACPAATFAANPASCPAASVVGVVKASTPLLPVGLSGPAYFVSNGGEEFPNLIVVLQGDGVRVDLVGDTFISHQGITSSTFKTVPDVPVNTFELYLPEGPYSALAANTSLCTAAQTGTRTVRRKETVRVHGHKTLRTVTKRVAGGGLVMPTEFRAQNGMVFKQNTTITVTDCNTKAKAARAGRARTAHVRRTGGQHR
jgi:uncharacterized repeat protein (TIGR01451 family)